MARLWSFWAIPSAASLLQRAGMTRRSRKLCLVAFSTAAAFLVGITPAQGGPNDYAFLNVAPDGSPSRWNSCAAIPYKVNVTDLPEGALADVHEAVRRVAAASGLTFTYNGTTTLKPTTDEGRFPDERLIFGWVGAEDVEDSGGGAVGWGGISWTEGDADGKSRVRYGSVMINKNALLAPGFTEAPSRGEVLMHELGHAVGLAHVGATEEVMHAYGSNRKPVDWGEGDRQGLHAVGTRHGCLPYEPHHVSVPSRIQFGQAADVWVSGFPGEVFDLYARKYPSTSYTKIRSSLRLDASGRMSVRTYPNVNMRFMAQTAGAPPSSTAGADGLLTVQKQLSMNVSRVSGRLFTVSGSLKPPHPGAVVHLYRDGVLFRKGIPVSSAGTYSVRLVLDYGFYDMRTPATGYNAASATRPRFI